MSKLGLPQEGVERDLSRQSGEDCGLPVCHCLEGQKWRSGKQRTILQGLETGGTWNLWKPLGAGYAAQCIGVCWGPPSRTAFTPRESTSALEVRERMPIMQRRDLGLPASCQCMRTHPSTSGSRDRASGTTLRGQRAQQLGDRYGQPGNGCCAHHDTARAYVGTGGSSKATPGGSRAG